MGTNDSVTFFKVFELGSLWKPRQKKMFPGLCEEKHILFGNLTKGNGAYWNGKV